MLSAAKHLLFLIENKQKPIPRSTRDERVGVFSSSPLLGLAGVSPMIPRPSTINGRNGA